jgi:hypothetical protein
LDVAIWENAMLDRPKYCLFDVLTFFQPRPHQLRFVNSRNRKVFTVVFGMKGVIAENHFDGSRNSIVVLGGERRYILSHPDQCELLATYPKEHPSARHSAVDWSASRFGTLFQSSAPPKRVKLFCKLAEIVRVPAHEFVSRCVISLDLNFQCNTRSGVGQEYMRLPFNSVRILKNSVNEKVSTYF